MPFAACEETVRRHDPDRYFAALFAPEAARRRLFALYAFYYELVHAVRAVREPMLAQIRLEWWRETVELARQGRPRDHAVAKALEAVLAEAELPSELFNRIIDARVVQSGTIADAGAAEAFADATVGSLMRLAARILGTNADDLVRDAAIAYGLAGQEICGIDTAMLARTHYAAARKVIYPREVLPAAMPAALTPLYLKRRDPPLWKKQLVYLRAAALGRI